MAVLAAIAKRAVETAVAADFPAPATMVAIESAMDDRKMSPTWVSTQVTSASQTIPSEECAPRSHGQYMHLSGRVRGYLGWLPDGRGQAAAQRVDRLLRAGGKESQPCKLRQERPILGILREDAAFQWPSARRTAVFLSTLAQPVAFMHVMRGELGFRL